MFKGPPTWSGVSSVSSQVACNLTDFLAINWGQVSTLQLVNLSKISPSFELFWIYRWVEPACECGRGQKVSYRIDHHFIIIPNVFISSFPPFFLAFSVQNQGLYQISHLLQDWGNIFKVKILNLYPLLVLILQEINFT